MNYGWAIVRSIKMSRVKFIQHIPGFVVGSEPDIIESNSLEELLKKVEKYKSDSTVYTCDETGEYLNELGYKD